MNIPKSAINAKKALTTSHQIYHIYQAREEYGDSAVINAMASRLHQQKNIPIPEAFKQAASCIVAIDDMKNRVIDGKAMRRELEVEAYAVDALELVQA